jgi:hypothetical protein
VLGEKNVISSIGIEGRVEIYEVHAVVLNVEGQDFDVVTVDQKVLVGHVGSLLGCAGPAELSEGSPRRRTTQWFHRDVQPALPRPD